MPPLAIALAALFGLEILLGATEQALAEPPAQAYITDTIAYAQIDAELVLAGQNPYTATTAFADALRRYPVSNATPLRRGVFGGGYIMPRTSVVTATEQQYLVSPSSARGGFDPLTAHSYPALSFLLYVPLVWAGVPNLLVLHLALYVLLLAAILWLAPGRLRVRVALAALSIAVIPLYSLYRETEIVCVLFMLAAWHWRDRRWASAVLLGLGCAYKQYCWFFVPFFVVDAWRTSGWREALRRAAIAGGAFLVPNLPYLWASPHAWWMSLFLPVSEPLFPSGVGGVALAVGHVLPFAPPAVFTALEVGALLACLWAYVRWHGTLREAALLLALVPLWFAWRSLPDYFSFAPLFALYAAATAARAAHRPSAPANQTVAPAETPPLATTTTGGGGC